MTQDALPISSTPDSLAAGHSLARDAWLRLKKNRMAMAGLYVTVALSGLCFIGPSLLHAWAGYDYESQDLVYGPRAPSAQHWFGTDFFGRDLFTRVLCGGQISLTVGLLAASVAAGIGTLYGALSGYVGGRLDSFMMRVVDVIYALPYMFLVIVLVTIFGKSLPLLFIALGLVGWLMTARIVRGQVLSLREREFVLAARNLGVRGPAILFRHLIPNTLGPIIVYFTLTVPSMILQEAFLSFIGLGVQAPRPSLGALISDGAQHMAVFWWELVFPGGVMALLLFSLNFLGDGVRDALDPQLRGRGVTALLSVNDLCVYFRSDHGVVKAVDGVSLSLERGEILGLVGESGSGKTVTNLALLGLLPKHAAYFPRGTIHFEGQELLHAGERALRKLRGRRIAMIFQDAMAALNPYLTVERQLTEVLELHERVSYRVARTRSIDMLARVGIADPERRMRAYPHELSGGMRQRVMIAMALLCGPDLLIADEPTTAVDVTVQAQVLELIRDLQRASSMSVILITHDLGVVAGMAHRIAVMYAGRIVEGASVTTLFQSPLHPYTQGLLASVPRMEASREHPLQPIPGLPPDLARLPAGCPFQPRCARAFAQCVAAYPELHAPREQAPEHQVRCWAVQQTAQKTATDERA